MSPPMQLRSLLRILLIAGLASSSLAATAEAQLRGDTIVTGLAQPLGFVQDPTDSAVQYVVQQGGRIRVVRSGELQVTDFLDLSLAISTGGERGLLGLAFAPDYATSRRFFVNFTNASGHTVVARFRRDATNPLAADPSSRFDLQWSTGERFIRQPFSNHNGGHLAFGSDGFLYIGMGDGGSGNDPDHLAQNPASLLGKMLRINVSVADADVEGYDVPADNPFVGAAGYAAEIWSFGLRNPWQFSFDELARGGTGALIIGDVGQGTWEEIDYEPAGRGGRNYGWRNREGAHDNVTTMAPAYLPLVDPVFEYGRGFGASITGGHVYRGARLGTSFRGRYFFADFVSGRVASIALTISPTGEATASDLQEHTTALGGNAVLGNISSFGVDADGELYVVNWTAGTIVRIASSVTPLGSVVQIDTPPNGARVRQPFLIAGWAADFTGTAGTGIDAVHVWAFPRPGSGDPGIFVGANYGASRPDVAAVHGARFQPSGFSVVASGLAAGPYRLAAFAREAATGKFNAVQTVDVTIEPSAVIAIDTPLAGVEVTQPFYLAGWAADFAASAGSGIDAVHVWAFGQEVADSPRFVGAADYGGRRPDIESAFGSQFVDSGFTVVVRGLPPGQYLLVAYGHSTVSGTFDVAAAVNVTAHTSPIMSVDLPANGATVDPSFVVAGWAIDAAAAEGAGVDAVHVWAFPASGADPTFLGSAAYGVNRPDVAAVFGINFERSGYWLDAAGLVPGRYLVVVFARSVPAGMFNQSRSVEVVVR
jgi:glucose/arabinose dehydrogenase